MADGPLNHHPLKIAFITDWYWPRVGGIEVQVRNLARRLTIAGHKVEVITPTPGPVDTDGPRINRIQAPLFPYWRFIWTPGAFTRMEAILRRGGFDLVHCHVSLICPAAYGGIYLARKIGLPAVVTCHSLLNGFRPVLRALDRVWGWSGWPVAYGAVSALAAESLRPLVDPQPVHVLPNGVDVDWWRVDRMDPPEGEVRVVTVTRLSVRKRVRNLVRLIPRVLGRLPSDINLKVTVIGDGPERRLVERLIRRLSLNGTVELTGRLTHEAIREWFRRADLFVLPSVWESFGLAALEARAAGLPVIGRSQAGLHEFIRHGREGLLADTDRDMADMLASLILDETRRKAMARHNRETRPAQDWEAILARHMDVYRYAMGKRVSSGLAAG